MRLFRLSYLLAAACVSALRPICEVSGPGYGYGTWANVPGGPADLEFKAVATACYTFAGGFTFLGGVLRIDIPATGEWYNLGLICDRDRNLLQAWVPGGDFLFRADSCDIRKDGTGVEIIFQAGHAFSDLWYATIQPGGGGDFAVIKVATGTIRTHCYRRWGGNFPGECCSVDSKTYDWCADTPCVDGVCQQKALPCGKGDSSGHKGDCCRSIKDCRGGCFEGKCIKDDPCQRDQWGTGNGKGLGEHCCRDSDDCNGSCKKGMCTPKYSCDREMGQGDGELGDCCQTSEDCVLTCDTYTGKCRNTLIACPSMNGNAGSCCKVNSDCKSGKCPLGKCIGGVPATTTLGPIPTGGAGCTPGWCGTKTGKGPVGACCSVEADCDDACNGNGKCGVSDDTWKQPLACPNPTKTTTTTAATVTTTATGKTCKSGYYGKNLKNGPDGFCCATVNDCIGSCTFVPGDSYMCIGGSLTTTVAITTAVTTTTTATTAVPTPVCIKGMEGIEDGESEEGYCCTTSMDCWGDCNNGVCGPPKNPPNSPTNKCIPDGFAYRNGNLPSGYCCSTNDDCLYANCIGAVCSGGSTSPCSPPKTTTTTTTSTSTKTSGENPKETSVDFPKIVFPSPIPCVVCPFPLVVGGFLLKLGGFFVGLFGGHDDDDNNNEEMNEDDTRKIISSLMPPPAIFTSASTTWTFIPPVITYTTNATSSPTSTAFATTVTDSTAGPTSSTAGPTTTTGPTIATTISPTMNPTTITETVINPTTGTTNTTLVSPTIGTTTNTTNTTVINPTTGTTNTTLVSPTIGTTIGTTTGTTTGTTIGTTTAITTKVTTGTATTIGTVTETTSRATITTGTTTMRTTTTTAMTTTMAPTGKTCKSGHYGKKLKNAPDGSCCATSADCTGNCVYVPGDSYMCQNGDVTTTSVGTTTTSAITLPTTTATPTPTCIPGHCGLAGGKGPTGACCADHWDCKEVCNGDGKCSDNDDGTWMKKLPCP